MARDALRIVARQAGRAASRASWAALSPTRMVSVMPSSRAPGGAGRLGHVAGGRLADRGGVSPAVRRTATRRGWLCGGAAEVAHLDRPLLGQLAHLHQQVDVADEGDVDERGAAASSGHRRPGPAGR